MSEKPTPSEQGDTEARCSVCGRPLIDWGEHHTVEDCARFEAMTPQEKLHLEHYIVERRREGCHS